MHRGKSSAAAFFSHERTATWIIIKSIIQNELLQLEPGQAQSLALASFFFSSTWRWHLCQNTLHLVMTQQCRCNTFFYKWDDDNDDVEKEGTIGYVFLVLRLSVQCFSLDSTRLQLHSTIASPKHHHVVMIASLWSLGFILLVLVMTS